MAWVLVERGYTYGEVCVLWYDDSAGRKKAGELRFCNDGCHQKGVLLTVADEVPADLVEKYIQEVHGGECPKCQGQGPIDVHTSHRVWSALVMTSWSSRPQVCCTSCGTKSKIGDAALSFFLGWWGFPWGLILTPIQVTRNITGLFASPDPTRPSPELERMLRLNLAAELVQQSQQENAPQSPQG